MTATNGTANPTKPYTAEQKKLVTRLRRVAIRMVTANRRVDELKEQRRQLLVEAYDTGIDTVQLGQIIGMSTETVRKNVEAVRGSLRYPDAKTG